MTEQQQSPPEPANADLDLASPSAIMAEFLTADVMDSIELVAAKPKLISANIDGMLEDDDLLALFTAGGVPGAGRVPTHAASDIKVQRERHHSVARMIAQGMSHQLIATLTGYEPGYIGILLEAPSMEALVSHYRAQVGNAHDIIIERVRYAGMSALEQLISKFESGEAVDDSTLVAVAKLGLDRSGHGPTSRLAVMTSPDGPTSERLAALERAARQQSAPYILNHKQPSTPLLEAGDGNA